MLRVAYQSFSLDFLSRCFGASILSLSIFMDIVGVIGGQCRPAHHDPFRRALFVLPPQISSLAVEARLCANKSALFGHGRAASTEEDVPLSAALTYLSAPITVY